MPLHKRNQLRAAAGKCGLEAENQQFGQLLNQRSAAFQHVKCDYYLSRITV